MDKPNEPGTECGCCGWPSSEGRWHERQQPPNPANYDYPEWWFLCALCADSMAGAVVQYDHEGGDVTRTICHVGNAILAKLDGPVRHAEELRAALIAHRADLHGHSHRPCATCRQSARALRIDVPNHCAHPQSDREALGE